MENVNKKLKAIYFHWAINYDGPPPRSISANFEDYLELERYTFLGDDLWLEKVLAECSLANKTEFDEQMVLIENQFNIPNLPELKSSNASLNSCWVFITI